MMTASLVCASQIETGYRLEVVTVRKLEFETDAFAFADKVRGQLGCAPSTGHHMHSALQRTVQHAQLELEHAHSRLGLQRGT